MANSINASDQSAGSAAHQKPAGNGTKPRRFPDFVLAGSINLHKSPVNAAALARHIARQWSFLRINHNGIISSKQLDNVVNSYYKDVYPSDKRRLIFVY